VRESQLVVNARNATKGIDRRKSYAARLKRQSAKTSHPDEVLVGKGMSWDLSPALVRMHFLAHGQR